MFPFNPEMTQSHNLLQKSLIFTLHTTFTHSTPSTHSLKYAYSAFLCTNSYINYTLEAFWSSASCPRELRTGGAGDQATHLLDSGQGPLPPEL